MSRPAIVKWCQMFENGRKELSNAEIEGKLATVTTPDMGQRVEDINHSNGKVEEAHIKCSGNAKNIWMEDNFSTMTRFTQLFLWTKE